MAALFTLLPEAVATVTAENKAAILGLLAARFAAVYGLDGDEVQRRMAEREALGSTGFGRGVAIPHARVPGVAGPVAVFLRLRAAVPFDSVDSRPVDLVFGLLSPDQAGAAHLHALAAISRMMRAQRMRDMLIAASDAEAIYAVLANVIDRDAA